MEWPQSWYVECVLTCYRFFWRQHLSCLPKDLGGNPKGTDWCSMWSHEGGAEFWGRQPQLLLTKGFMLKPSVKRMKDWGMLEGFTQLLTLCSYEWSSPSYNCAFLCSAHHSVCEEFLSLWIHVRGIAGCSALLPFSSFGNENAFSSVVLQSSALFQCCCAQLSESVQSWS